MRWDYLITIINLVKKKGNNMTKAKNVVIGVCIFIIIVLLSSLVYLLLNPIKEEVSVRLKDYNLSSAIAKVYDAVVVVETYQNDRLVSSGTGFVYQKSNRYGYILTNNHVITNQENINIIFSNGEYTDASIIGTDLFLDVAVLRVPVDKVLEVANIGKSYDSKLGDTVFTIGAPIGNDFSGTVTRGILSGKDRMITINQGSGNIQIRAIQTDAAINPGNSGGPLLNLNSEVIGINSLKLASSTIEGMGFAIPIEDIMHHIETLEAGETITRPFLGVTLLDLSETFAINQAGINIPETVRNGVVVSGVTPNSPASTHLRVGDIITQINDKSVSRKSELRYYLHLNNVGDTIKLTIKRDNQTTNFNIRLTQAE